MIAAKNLHGNQCRWQLPWEVPLYFSIVRGANIWSSCDAIHFLWLIRRWLVVRERRCRRSSGGGRRNQWAVCVAADVSDEAAIMAVIQSYVSAFNSQDVPRLVGLWSPEGVYTSRTTGEETVGREAMAASLNELFENKTTAPKLGVATNSIELVSPNVAIEQGTASVALATGEIEETGLQRRLCETRGAWLIDRVTEDTDES